MEAKWWDLSNAAAYWAQALVTLFGVGVTIWLCKKQNASNRARDKGHDDHAASIQAMQQGDSARQLTVASLQLDNGNLRAHVEALEKARDKGHQGNTSSIRALQKGDSARRVTLAAVQKENGNLRAHLERLETVKKEQEAKIEALQNDLDKMKSEHDEQSIDLDKALCEMRRQIERRLNRLEVAGLGVETARQTTSGADSPASWDPVASGGASTASASRNPVRKDSARGKGATKPAWR